MIELYTAPTPSGIKVSVALEELGLRYDARQIDAGDDPLEALRFLNPADRPPLIHDRETGVSVFEPAAILVYLAEKSGSLLPTDAKNRAATLQWLMFQTGSLRPMMNQAIVFLRTSKLRIPYAIERYQREVARLLAVLDGRLADRRYLADTYSIADIANWCWARTHEASGVGIDALPNLMRWMEEIAERPAVRRVLGA